MEDAWNFFYTEFIKIIDNRVPWTTIKFCVKHLTWINGNLLNLFKQKDKGWEKYQSTKDSADWTTYKQDMKRQIYILQMLFR